MTEDEMVGWHHQLNGHEFEQTPRGGEGQRDLVCPWGHRVGHDWVTEQQPPWSLKLPDLPSTTLSVFTPRDFLGGTLNWLQNSEGRERQKEDTASADWEVAGLISRWLPSRAGLSYSRTRRSLPAQLRHLKSLWRDFLGIQVPTASQGLHTCSFKMQP